MLSQPPVICGCGISWGAENLFIYLITLNGFSSVTLSRCSVHPVEAFSMTGMRLSLLWGAFSMSFGPGSLPTTACSGAAVPPHPPLFFFWDQDTGIGHGLCFWWKHPYTLASVFCMTMVNLERRFGVKEAKLVFPPAVNHCTFYTAQWSHVMSSAVLHTWPVIFHP